MKNNNILAPEKATQRAQALCARQERCSNDISTKLRQWQVPSDEIEKIIKKLQDDGFINDERYARMFARDKSKINKWGPLKISYSLKSKHIAENIIKDAIAELEPPNDNILKDLLLKKMKGTKAKSSYDLKNKLIRFGISRGFDFGLVNKIASSIINEL